MRIAKDKQKQKTSAQKQNEILRSIHDEVEQELYCLKKQEEMLLKLIEREQKKLGFQNHSYEFPIQSQGLKKQYNLRKKHQLSNQEIELEQKQNNLLKSMIPLSPKDQMQIAQSYIYTGSKRHEDLPRKSHRRDDIFRMDEELYEQDEQEYGIDN